MIKKLSILFITLLFSSFQQHNENACITEIFKTVDKNTAKKYKKEITTNEFGLRHSIDSLNYNIIRRWTKKRGNAIVESVENEFVNIGYWKDYYENGNIKEEGFVTSVHSTRIGIWKFYSENKKLLRKYDYDAERKMSFCKFYRFCVNKNLLNPYSDFRYESGAWIVSTPVGDDTACLTKVITIYPETETFFEKVWQCYY